MEIPKNLKDEIWEYCRLNDISNIDEFIVKMIRQGYTSEKFGATPVGYGSVKEVEKVVEVIKEVPVEKIVTKIEYVSDKSGETELIEKLNILEEENKKFSTKLSESEEEIQKFSTKVTEMENIFQKETSLRDKEIEKLKKELEEEKKKIKNETDIYGDEKRGGWFGSNILKR